MNGVCDRMMTSFQVRDRLDRLFPRVEATHSLPLNNIALGYVRLDADDGLVQRCFFEHHAIGLLRSIFNATSER
jgi:hypothetical protein